MKVCIEARSVIVLWLQLVDVDDNGKLLKIPGGCFYRNEITVMSLVSQEYKEKLLCLELGVTTIPYFSFSLSCLTLPLLILVVVVVDLKTKTTIWVEMLTSLSLSLTWFSWLSPKASPDPIHQYLPSGEAVVAATRRETRDTTSLLILFDSTETQPGESRAHYGAITTTTIAKYQDFQDCWDRLIQK